MAGGYENVSHEQLKRMARKALTEIEDASFLLDMMYATAAEGELAEMAEECRKIVNTMSQDATHDLWEFWEDYSKE